LYSNYYSWEALRKIETEDAAREAAEAMRHTTKPLSNCLWMSDTCATAFKAAVRADPIGQVRLLAKRISIATDKNWHQRLRSSRECHCIAMMKIIDYCIVLDPVAHHAAIEVPVGQMTRLPNTNFKYTYIALGTDRVLVNYNAKSSEGNYSVMNHRQSSGIFNYGDPFAEVTGGFAGGNC
jgi:hypothetical protein